jgi:hypothetical protein
MSRLRENAAAVQRMAACAQQEPRLGVAPVRLQPSFEQRGGGPRAVAQQVR